MVLLCNKKCDDAMGLKQEVYVKLKKSKFFVIYSSYNY